MIRISRETLARVWVFVRSASMAGMTHWAARDAVLQQVRDRDDSLICELVDRGPDEDLEALLKQLVTSKESYQDGKVLEDILEVLSRVYATNTVDPRSLELLRAAIMIPGERGRLAATLEKVEGHCADCGHAFVNGEVAVLERKEVPHDRRTQYTYNLWYCTRCHEAVYQSCHVTGCDDHVALPQKVRAVMTNDNLKCRKHVEEANGDYKKTKGDPMTVGDILDANRDAPWGAPVPAPPIVRAGDRIRATVAGRMRGLDGRFPVQAAEQPPQWHVMAPDPPPVINREWGTITAPRDAFDEEDNE